MSCLHNQIFALCRYGRKGVPGERVYRFVALMQPRPVTLRLERER